MAQSIILKRSSLTGKVPDTGSLHLGELAVNTYDGKIYFNKSGSVESIQTIVTTDSTTTGSISITDTGSFGEIIIKNDLNVSGGAYIKGDIVGNTDLDVLGSITGSSLRVNGTGSFESLKVNDTLTVNHGTTIISGSQLITQELTVLGPINATQFNINIISSSTIYQSGSTKFGDTFDDVMSVTGSIQLTGSLSVSGSTIFTELTGSLFAFSSSIATINSTQNTNITTNSASAWGAFQSASSYSASQDLLNKTFATTGSNEFNGNQIITGSVTATAFVGDGSGLTNLVVDLSTAQLNDVDGNNIPPRSFAELYVGCASFGIVDLDFNN